MRNNKTTSGYVQHILETGHTFGNINDTMEIFKVKKGLYFREFLYI
jgi:hypothetical protein